MPSWFRASLLRRIHMHEAKLLVAHNYARGTLRGINASEMLNCFELDKVSRLYVTWSLPRRKSSPETKSWRQRTRDNRPRRIKIHPLKFNRREISQAPTPRNLAIPSGRFLRRHPPQLLHGNLAGEPTRNRFQFL